MTRFLAAAGASSLLALTVATPAGAVPGPRSEQWWFSAWAIQQRSWPLSKGAGVTVAVIDTGVNAQLPDLRSAVVPGTNLDAGSGDGRTDNDSDPRGHGTGMSALIASQGNQSGFVGVAPEAKVMPIVAQGYATMPKGIRYAVDHGAKVISISQAFPASQGCAPDFQKAVAYAIQKDAVVVAAAGNEGDKSNPSSTPANCAGVLAVGAVDNQKRAWTGTQRQSYVAVAAPGLPVASLGKDGKLIAAVPGTSQAAALTSGAVALVRSKFPQMSNREVVQRVIASAVDAGPPGKDNMTGAGVVFPPRALTGNVPKSAPNPVFAKYDQWARTQPQGQGGGQAGTQTPGIAEPKNNDDRNSIITLVIALGGILGVLLLAVVIFVFARRGGKGGPPSGGYGGGPGAGPGQQAGGPPPGWGAGAPGQSGGFPTPPQGPPGQQGPPPGYRG